jgi:hypothetical protein
MDKRITFLPKKAQHMKLSSFLNRVRGGVETKMSAGEGASSGRPHTPRIKVEKRNAKQCHN